MKTVIKIAEAAGFERIFKDVGDWVCFTDEIERFAEFVRADEADKYKWNIHSCGPTCDKAACVETRKAVEAEREACAKVCDDLYRVWVSTDNDDITPPDALDCKLAIQARGNT